MKIYKKNSDKKPHGFIDPIVFFPTFIILIGCVLLGIWKYDLLLKGLLTIYKWASDNFGWTYAVITVLSLFALVVIFLHPVGKKKLGGEDAKPEMSTFSWFCITLTSTIGVSMIMWGSVEPILHFANPPAFSGIQAFSEEAATFALSTGYIHWSFNQYALYTLAALAIAIGHFNYKQPLNVAGGMYFAIGKNKMAGRVSDALCLLVIAGGVATSLGIGIQQITTGCYYAFGIEPTQTIKLIVTCLIVIIYSIASASGVKKGISYISKVNVWIFLGLLAFTYFVGPTLFINKLSVQSLGEFLSSGIKRSLMTAPISGDPWPKNWTLNFYVTNAAYAPLLGVFLAKIAKGRSIRSFIGMNLGVCSAFNIIWFNVFGGASIYEQIHGIDLALVMEQYGLESATFAFFQTLPLGKVIVPIFTVAIFFSFVTMAESLITSMAEISIRSRCAEEHDKRVIALKLLWGIFIGVLAYFLLGLVGVEVIKYTYLVFGFPIFIILIMMMYSLLKSLFFREFSLKEAVKNFFMQHNN